MTDPHNSPSDEFLEELLAPFRAISVPDEVCISNREKVRVALAGRGDSVWWRRTVAIPVPIAIAATLLFAVAVLGLLRSSSGPSQGSQEMARQKDDQEIASTPMNHDHTGPTWNLTRQYLPSLLPLAVGQDSLNASKKERGNDS